MILRRFTLGQVVFILLVLMVFPVGWFVISSLYVGAQQQLAEINQRLFQEQLSNLSLEVVRDLRSGHIKSAQRLVSVAAASDTLIHLSVVDKSAKVINSTHYAWLGQPATAVIQGLNSTAFLSAMQDKKIHTYLDAEKAKVYIYYPIDMSASFQSNHLGHGMMVAQFTFQKQDAILERKQQQQLFYFGMILLLIALLFIVLLRKFVAQPLLASMRFIQDIEQGKKQTSLTVTGTKEVVHLAETLLSMHAALQTSQSSLKQTNILLSNIMESVPDLVFLKDKAGVYLDCNQAFCALAGKSNTGDVVGCTDFDLFDAEQASVFRAHDKHMFEQGESQRSEAWVIYPDGHKGLLDILKSPYRDEQGALLGLIGISRDITAIKDLEEQFQQAQKMEAIGTLVGGIAHDFNNILAAMTGNMYLAKRCMLQGDVSEAVTKVERIEGLSEKAASMIAQLLSFSRKGVVQMQELSMRAFVQESLQLAQVTIPENVQIKHMITDEPLLVHADPSQLQQVLMNLLNNARDAVENIPHPMVTVTLDMYEPSEKFMRKYGLNDAVNFVHLSVQDNGCGIDEKDLQHIFDPFFTTKEVDKGTGLGLSMVYGTIQSHGGMIEVESELGQGTSFHVYLPLTAPSQVQESLPIQSQTFAVNEELILLADDETDVRETTAEVLESLGYRVLQAKDGEEALVLFAAHQTDISLVILDVVMPKLGGMALAQALREIQADIPVILMTGYDKDNVLEACDTLLQSQILTKPIHFEVLQDTISQLLHDSS